jgi:hypothetical protein
MKTLILFFSALLLFLPGIIAQQTTRHPSGVFYCLDHDTSPQLSKMHMLAPSQGQAKRENDIIPNYHFLFQTDEKSSLIARDVDPVVQQQFGELPPNSTIVNIDGIGNLNITCPPDPNMDVGPNHIIQTVNLSFAIYSKTGTLLYGPAALRTIWQGFVNWTGDGDPIVLYDHLADRWLISQFALPDYPFGPGYELIAISQTSDPLGSWHRYKFEFTEMPDYPKLGVWPDGYYLSVNTIEFNTGNWIGPAAAVLERDSMLTGNNARMIFFQQSDDLMPMLPADLDGPEPPASSPGLFMMAADMLPEYGGDQLNIYELHTDWANIANSTFTGPQVISTAPFDMNMCDGNRNCIPQANSSRKIDALPGYLMHRLQYRNFGSDQVLVTNHTVDADGTDHAGIRWYELRNEGSGWSVFQQGTYAPDTNHRWIASAAMDGQHNIAMGYSVSGTDLYPSIRATGRRSTDPPGIMTFLEEPVMNGAGSQQLAEGRWGDYSMLAVDPSDDQTFWYTNEYYPQTSELNWMTRIASFTINTLPVGIEGKHEQEKSPGLLIGNYPNPFERTTVITYRIEVKCRVTLKVFDMMGREIITLVNELSEPGVKSVTFNAENLKKGIYFYQFSTENEVDIKKMIIN